jgi:YjbE family integral membrane protein
MDAWLGLPFSDFLAALASIVVIDLVLAGDNAIVIAMAARSLPARLQKQAIIGGTFGAIVVRSLMTLSVVWLLKVPGLLLAGGAALIWIAYHLLADEEDAGAHRPAATSLWTAIRTIVVADAVMGLDNVLGVAGASHGSPLLVVLGLVISIPLVASGSGLVLRLIERFPAIAYLGAAVLAYTAARMVVAEPLSKAFFADHPVIGSLVYALIFGTVVGGGYWAKRRNGRTAGR